MVEIGITRMSSKGQVVIPLNMRKSFREGEKIFVLEKEGNLVLKKANKFNELFNEDLEFARRTEEAYKEIEAGKGIRMEFDDFLTEIDKW